MPKRHLSLIAAAAIGAIVSVAIIRTRSAALADSPPPSHATAAPAAAHDTAPSVAPAEAMRRLREGNERFVHHMITHPHEDAARQADVARAQHPFAIVLGCADSRVPPEVVFDQGLGDLFVIRVAGEVAAPEVIGSIEYAVDHLGCRTIIVLGHQRCGAVEAALSAGGASDHATPAAAAADDDLAKLIAEITPAIRDVDRSSPNALDAAVTANTRAVAHALTDHSKLLADRAEKGQIVIIPAHYGLDSGKVDFLDTRASATR